MINLLPLQTYSAILAMSLASSQKAMLDLRNGLLTLNPLFMEKGKNLQEKLAKIDQKELVGEIQKQVKNKLLNYLKTLPVFYGELNSHTRGSSNVPVVWQEGSSKLYNYSTQNKPDNNLLLIPSLINRHYIMDLDENNSFVKYLSNNGINSFLAAWDDPREDELAFSLDNYVLRTQKMIDFVYNQTGKPIILAGYCMGGLLALAAAMGNTEKLKAIAFLATPWDFHAPDFPKFNLENGNIKNVENIINNYQKIPAYLIQAIFYYLQAYNITQKFENFPLFTINWDGKNDFFSIENWINDGLAMTNKVAKQCFIDWVHNNKIAKLNWNVCGVDVSPAQIGCLPSFFAIPQKDSIVPPLCAIPLTKYFENHILIKPNTGHIGMMAGPNAMEQFWQPFLNFLAGLNSTPKS